MAFHANGLLVHEFELIFHDIFNGKGGAYKKILNLLKDGGKTLSEIRSNAELANQSNLSVLLDHLRFAGFISQQTLWSFKTGESLKQKLYRISDPFIRFYLKMIVPDLEAITQGRLEKIPFSAMSGIDTHFGLQIEALLLQNQNMIQEKLGISPLDIIRSGPFRQNKTSEQRGCQIDYLTQTKSFGLFVCEFKFKKNEIKYEVISDMKEKLLRLKAPKGFAKVPVLFHLNGVSDSVATSQYFYRIVDISDFLDEPSF